MTSLSRSARNRLARDAARSNQPAPRGTVQPRQVVRLGDPHVSTASIRIVGYLGRNPTRVSYSGSGTDGYKSEWARDGYDFFTDPAWDRTVSDYGRK